MNPDVSKSDLLGSIQTNTLLGGQASRQAGGLNLVSSPDAIQPGEAVAAQNWRTDQAGILRSRKGHTLVQALSGYVHTLFTVQSSSGPRRYSGANDVLYRNGVSIGTGYDGNPLGVVSFQDRLWVMNPSHQKKDDGTNYWDWTPAASGAAPTGVTGGAASGGLNGSYVYYASGQTAQGEETNAPYGLYVTVAANDSITLTHPAFTDPQITGWNVYRTGGAFPLQPYRVNATVIPLGSTYLDTGTNLGVGLEDQTDLGIAELGITRPTDHTPAPAAKGCAGPYFNKILAFNSAAHPNRIWWTPSNQPSYFPGADSEQDGNWVDVGEEGEEIVAIAVFPRWVAILKGQTIHRLVGDPDDWGSDIERTNAEVGLMGPKAFAVAGSTVYFQGEEGIYAFNGDTAVKISPQLDPIFKGDSITTFAAVPSTAIASGYRSKNCMAYRNGRLYFSYTDGANTIPNLMFVWEGGRWVSDTRGFTALYYEGQGQSLLGAVGGSVYAIGNTHTDNGAAIPLIYQSRYEDQGAPENKKRYSDVLIEHNTGGHTFNVHAYLENGTADIFLGTISSTSLTQQTFIIGDAEYRNIAIRLESSDAGTSHCEIHTLAVHYLMLERNARTYDSEKIPLERLSLLNALEMNLEILSGSVTYALYTESFGGAMIQLAADTLTGSGVETFQVRLAANTVAQWVRLILNGDNFRNYGSRLQYQPMGPEQIPGPPRVLPLLKGGVAIEGVFLNSRTYDTGRVALDKTSLLETLEVELEIFSGSVTYQFYSGMTALEHPGLTGTFTGAAYETFTIPVAETEARWVRVVLTGTDFKCHGAKLKHMPYGCYLAGVGDTFRSGDLTLGSPRVKLLSQVRVDCDPDGTIPGVFYTDTPTALLPRQNLSLTATYGRQWQRQNLPRDTRGRVLRIEFTANSVCRIYAIQVRAKVLGEGSSSWQWLDVPVEPTPPGFSWLPLPIA